MKVAQLCLTLCEPMDYTVHGILQARILGGYLFPSPGDLPNSGIQPRSSAFQVDSLPSKPPGKPIPKVAPTHLLMSEILITGKKASDARQGDKASTGPKNKTTGDMGVSLVLLMVLQFLCSSLIYREK